MNLTQGHGEKIKFGSASAIFLVTCENTMGLCLQIPSYFSPASVLLSCPPTPKFKPFSGDLSI